MMRARRLSSKRVLPVSAQPVQPRPLVRQGGRPRPASSLPRKGRRISISGVGVCYQSRIVPDHIP